MSKLSKKFPDAKYYLAAVAIVTPVAVATGMAVNNVVKSITK